MTETHYYRAFGLTIASCIPVAQIPQIDPCEPDVRVVLADLSGVPKEERRNVTKDGNFVFTICRTVYRVTGGNLIEADIEPGDTVSNVGVYLMGSCMGAILIQRGFLLLHGSCVTDGTRSILITGDSGAGKSTLAAEFLKRGWKLITDDVTTVFDVDKTPMVQSSYPSQKLWQDALDRYGKEDKDIHSLFFTNDRQKFGVNVTASFYDGTCPLSMVVRLLPGDFPTAIGPIKDMAKVDQLLRNTYRLYFLPEKDRQRHFQRCVTLSTKIPMALVTRTNGEDCAGKLYDLITDYLGGNSHE